MFKNNSKVSKVWAMQILDSRGFPTLQVEVNTDSGARGLASVPSGASTGKKEALELRDKSKEYFGKGVLQACENVNTEINHALLGMEVTDQLKIDRKLIALDGTADKSRLGGNAIIGVSMACARAAAVSENLPLYKYLSMSSGIKMEETLPRPMFNLVNGGLHALSGLDIQEYLFIPRTDDMPEAVRIGAEVYHSLGQLLKNSGLHSGVGDEGGFAPKLQSNTEPFDLIISAAEKAGYKGEQDFGLGIDAAANSFSQSTGSGYTYKFNLGNKTFTSQELIDLYEEWSKKYHLVSIEDGLAEDDLESWKNMTKIFKNIVHVSGSHTELVGDDLFVTNAQRLVEGIKEHMATAVIIKPNQIGTLSQVFETVKAAKQHGYACIASHRSGDTADAFIADLAVGLGCEYIKAGAPARGERVAKYNRLLEIERELNA